MIILIMILVIMIFLFGSQVETHIQDVKNTLWNFSNMQSYTFFYYNLDTLLLLIKIVFEMQLRQ